MCDVSDNRLFNSISYHTPQPAAILPSISAAAENYNLTPRKHNRLLPERTIRDSLMLILFTELFILTFINYINILVLQFVNALINKRMYVCYIIPSRSTRRCMVAWVVEIKQLQFTRTVYATQVM